MVGEMIGAGLLTAIKKSKAGKFPALAQKAGIKMNSPLGLQIKKSDVGKLPPMLGGKTTKNNSKLKSAMKTSAIIAGR